ncbi:MAG: PT domain-containing protein [Thermosynechococcaceae cyanobacterium MS004]|nr:PT domain-containing protein [Thermosynechococcaceae cyanobacterium MS004]
MTFHQFEEQGFERQGFERQDLRLDLREIEQLSGIELHGAWVGGMIGGIYRFSQLKHPLHWLSWLLWEGITIALLFILTLPIGLVVSRLGGSESTRLMLSSMGLATLLGLLGWIGFRRQKARSLQTFLHLLDEIDRYHAVLDAVAVLDQLQAIQPTVQSTVQPTVQSTIQPTIIQPTIQDAPPGYAPPGCAPPDYLETLQLTRDCLVAGLKTERVLRGHLGRRSQTELGLAQLDHHLVTLQALSLQGQADEYSALLTQALAIGQSVRQEFYKQVSPHS